MENVEHASEVSVESQSAALPLHEVNNNVKMAGGLDQMLSWASTLSNTEYWRIFYKRSSEEEKALPPFILRKTNKSPIPDNESDESDEFLPIRDNAISTTTREIIPEGESPFQFQMRSQWENPTKLRSKRIQEMQSKIETKREEIQAFLTVKEMIDLEIREMSCQRETGNGKRIIYKRETGKSKREDCLHEHEELKKAFTNLEYIKTMETKNSDIKTMLFEIETRKAEIEVLRSEIEARQLEIDQRWGDSENSRSRQEKSPFLLEWENRTRRQSKNRARLQFKKHAWLRALIQTRRNLGKMDSQQQALQATEQQAPQLQTTEQQAPQLQATQLQALKLPAPQLRALQLQAPQLQATQLTATQLTAPQLTTPQLQPIETKLDEIETKLDEIEARHLKIPLMDSEISEFRHSKREGWKKRNDIIYKIHTGKAKMEDYHYDLEEFKDFNDNLEHKIETRETSIKTMLFEIETKESEIVSLLYEMQTRKPEIDNKEK
jgi:hypothetical protein